MCKKISNNSFHKQLKTLIEKRKNNNTVKQIIIQPDSFLFSVQVYRSIIMAIKEKKNNSDNDLYFRLIINSFMKR